MIAMEPHPQPATGRCGRIWHSLSAAPDVGTLPPTILGN